MYKVFVADKLAPEGVSALQQYPELEVNFAPGLAVEDAIAHAEEADAIIVRSATKLKGKLLASSRRLKVIGRAGIGVDNIDLELATEKGVVVLNTPDANATTTAELAIAHMFSVSRKLPEADNSVRQGSWERNSFMGNEISGKTVGIVGFGTIGRLVAERCLGLKMSLVGFDPFVTEETFKQHGIEKCTLEELVTKADYVTLHCPVTKDTRHLFCKKIFSLMKKECIFINCARGELVDEAALADVLTSGKIAGAALDVYENEPPSNSPLLGLKNIYFTPHLGASTKEAQTAVGVEIAHSVAAYLIRSEVKNAVNVPNVESEKAQQVLPYISLGTKLGLLASKMVEGTIKKVEIGSLGAIASMETHSIASSVIVGLLSSHHSVPVNQINALALARRQGIHVAELNSADSKDYVSKLRVAVDFDDGNLVLEGTIFDELYPRLIKLNEYEVESPLSGHLLFTWHADQPGVIGVLGDILGRMGVNISRMQVGVSNNLQLAVALLGISKELDDKTLETIEEVDAVVRALQIKV